VRRQFPQSNKRIQFNPANLSFHPVESVGKNPSVPSLIVPWATAGLMYCTDCHNNDQGPHGGGAARTARTARPTHRFSNDNYC
jgi:hypothetical protein